MSKLPLRETLHVCTEPRGSILMLFGLVASEELFLLKSVIVWLRPAVAH